MQYYCTFNHKIFSAGFKWWLNLMDEHMPIWLSYKPNSYIIPWDCHLQPIQTADDFLKPSTARSDESNFPNNNPYDSSTILFNSFTAVESVIEKACMDIWIIECF